MSKPLLSAILARLDALERRVLGHTRRRETRAQRARRKGVSVRTIARRVADGTEDQPEIENGRWYFWVDEPGQSQPERRTVGTLATKAARNPRLRKPAQTSPEI
jgi:hypothetical protein